MRESENKVLANSADIAQQVYGVILAAGNGSRLGYPNQLGGKAMVTVNGKPLLEFALHKLKEAGIKKIAVVVNPQNCAVIREYTANRQNFGLELCFVVQECPLGIAHALSLCENVTTNHKVALLLVDNVFEAAVTDSVAAFVRQNAKAMVFLTEVDNPCAFGVAKLEGTEITQIIEKPKNPPSNWVVIGFYLYDAGVYQVIKHIQPSARGELEITDVNKVYLANGKLANAKITGFWLDVGTQQSLQKAEMLLLQTGSKNVVLSNKKHPYV